MNPSQAAARAVASGAGRELLNLPWICSGKVEQERHVARGGGPVPNQAWQIAQVNVVCVGKRSVGKSTLIKLLAKRKGRKGDAAIANELFGSNLTETSVHIGEKKS